MYAFARRPLWMVSHLLVIVLVVIMVSAGFWQLRRLDERNALRDRLDERATGEPVTLGTALAGSLDDAEYQHVVVTGEYVAADQVAVRNRTYDGIAGRWVVTPLELDDGSSVLINRGFVPAAVEPPDPPVGAVTVTGHVRLTQERESIGIADPATGQLAVLNRLDVARVDLQTDLELLPIWIQRGTESPAVVDDGVFGLDPPTADGGSPHLSYAMQWFTFSLVALVGYPLVLRRQARAGQRTEVPDWDAPVESASDETVSSGRRSAP